MTYTKRMLYRLLYDALIELRARGYERDDRLVFALADIFHTVPLQLDRLDRGELSTQDIMLELNEHARRRDIGVWLDLRIREIAKYFPDTILATDAPE